MLVVDEFQDTDDDQWNIVRTLSTHCDLICLADPEQRIFDYRDNIDPKRLELLRKECAPTEFSLGVDNYRSAGAAGILQVADAILRNAGPLPQTSNVRFVSYQPRAFAPLFHAAVGWLFSQLLAQGVLDPIVAVMARSNAFVADLSVILSEEHTYKGHMLRPTQHDVVWDAALTEGAGASVASILEWSGKAKSAAIGDTLSFVASFYRMKDAVRPSVSARSRAEKFERAAATVSALGSSRLKAVGDMSTAYDELQFSGLPVRDWFSAREVLHDSSGLAELFARLVWCGCFALPTLLQPVLVIYGCIKARTLGLRHS